MPNQWAWSLQLVCFNGDQLSKSNGTQALIYQCQTNGHDPQSVCQNKERLLFCSKQYEVSISTNVFEVYILQVKINRRIYNSYLVIYLCKFMVDLTICLIN